MLAPTQILLLPRQRAILESIARSSSSPHFLVERARIVLLSADGVSIHEQAQRLGVNRQRVHTVSCDEKSGIQALERIASTKPVRPGSEEKIEFEYKRHGTTCLIVSFNVATGQVTPSLGATRKEEDFAAHIEANLKTDPEAVWCFIVDQLNTHFSETLVRLVAKFENLTIDLGEKGERGILESAKARQSFLSAPERRIRFIYTPKHCSWLNQVECWFSILVRRALKRASSSSVESLNQAILDFIKYFNAVLAKPFR